MPVTGYSDRINHAFAYAAKHHDQQVRKGTRLPYFTQPANVAVILTRYGCTEETVVAGILHDVVQGAVREGWSYEMLEERIGQKFGNSVLEIVLAVVERRIDDDGVELSQEDRRSDRLSRLSMASEEALWVVAATELHNSNTLLSDIRRTAFPETVWARSSAGRDGTLKWYRDVTTRLRDVGFDAAVVHELETVSNGLAGAAQ
jgi:(p)ppGpp synthase/HD superfamily hydrolase